MNTPLNFTLNFTLNAQSVTLSTAKDPDGHERSLLDLLRNELGLKATRLGCAQGQCGACTVIKDGQAILACETWISDLEGAKITTLEGLGNAHEPHPLQTAFIEVQAAQCGFCTSGIIMRSAALLEHNAKPTVKEIEAALHSNLCRCGVHERVIKAVLLASNGLTTTDHLTQRGTP